MPRTSPAPPPDPPRTPRLSDAHLATLLGACLFVCAAFPLLLTEAPPYQDAPNHLAAATVLAYPAEYPEFVSNGFLKTNAALFAWLHVVGPWLGLVAALKLFAAMAIAANAFVLPRFVLATGGRERMVVASLFAWPMAHNWFVSMGMLDFALSIPLALLLLWALDDPSTKASRTAIVFLGLATWYAHVFSLLVVFLVVAVNLGVEGWRAAGAKQRPWQPFADRLATWACLLPSTALTLVSLVRHATEPAGAWTGHVETLRSLPVWELAYNAWAEWFYAFTPLSGSSALACLGLLWVVFRRSPSEPVPTNRILSNPALATLLAFYVFVPYSMTHWFHVNSRFLPFLWVGALTRVPRRVPRALSIGLGASAALYFAGQAVDFVRLDRERAQFTEGIGLVPRGAKLLPLVFRHKETSDNTENLNHLWGYYVVEKHTSAPLLFAHSRAFPVQYKVPPPARFNQLVLESFAANMGTPSRTCEASESVRAGDTLAACTETWRRRWEEFWVDATPRFDHVLAWSMPNAAEGLIPAAYVPIFRNEKLVVYRREGGTSAAARNAREVGSAAPCCEP